jgi:hypothetical protein
VTECRVEEEYDEQDPSDQDNDVHYRPPAS